MGTLKLAELSGMILPKKLVRRKNESEYQLAKIEAQIETLRAKINQDEKNITLRESQALEFINDSASGVQIAKIQSEQAEASALVAELEKTRAETIEAIKSAESAVNDIVHRYLAQCRAEMRRQLEAVCRETDTLMQTGVKRPILNPPKLGSRSKVAVCEGCFHPIALILDDIMQPVKASHFTGLQGERSPFGDCQLENFTCPCCGTWRPWMKPDKILTNAGFKNVPKPEASA